MNSNLETSSDHSALGNDEPARTFLLNSIQYFGRHAPAFRGKDFLIRQGLARFARNLSADTSITTREGLRFLHCDLNQHIYWTLFVYGIWEADVTWIYNQILAEGDTVVDIGACFGYHALRAALRVGDKGRVYAVEPQPNVFSAFRENVRANKIHNIELDCMGLAAEDGLLELHRFSDLDVGNTSISTLSHTDYETISCPARTLDSYVAARNIENVTLIKLDVEGAELSVLRGATRLLSSDKPPMWVLEINMETAQSCGYHPNDLLKLLQSNGYSFYRPVFGEVIRKVRRLEKCSEGRHGQNLLCAIEDLHHDQLRKVGAI